MNVLVDKLTAAILGAAIAIVPRVALAEDASAVDSGYMNVGNGLAKAIALRPDPAIITSSITGTDASQPPAEAEPKARPVSEPQTSPLAAPPTPSLTGPQTPSGTETKTAAVPPDDAQDDTDARAKPSAADKDEKRKDTRAATAATPATHRQRRAGKSKGSPYEDSPTASIIARGLDPAGMFKP